MKDLILLVKAEITMEFIYLKRYPLETAVNIGIATLFFIVLLFTAKMQGKGLSLNLKDPLEEIMVGYLIWLLTTSSVQITSSEISQEALTGTMEQIYMSPIGPIYILLSRTIAGLLFSILFFPIMFYLLQVVGGIYLKLKLLSILPILILTFIGLSGIGFILGGITLVFKRIGLFLDIFPIILLVIALTPINVLPSNLQIFTLFFPLTEGVKLVRSILLEDQSFIFFLKNNEILILFLVSIFYFLVGIFGYNIADRIARDKGLLAHY